MAEGDLVMSASERDRAHVVRQVIEHRLSQREASERLGVSVRQVKRLVRSWRRQGDAGLVSRQRGRASHNRLPETLRAQVLALLRDKYSDFGPTLAAEKLLELDGVKVSRETIRQMQVASGLWKPKRRRVRRVFQLRDRRPRFGELIQIDGSPHDWFEGRGPRCTLIVFIDDATSRLTALRFVPVESTRAYLETLRCHVLEHGCPLAFYSDRHGIFRVNAKDAQSGDGKTEFGRVAARLRIEPIHALTPQAKGRVERANQTLQDRLVKEMRLQNVCSIEAANTFAPVFIAFWNGRFAVKPSDETSAHRPWTDTPKALEDALARHEERVLSKALTFSSAGTKYCVKTTGPGTALRGAKVMLRHFVGGGMSVHYKDRLLQVTAWDLPRPRRGGG
jgi:transposase